MDGFLEWFYQFMMTMLGGIWKIISGIGLGIFQIFNVVNYARQFAENSKSFSVLDWIVSIVALLLVIAIWAVIIAMIVLVVRKYIRFRKTIVGNEDMLQELADLHRDVSRLTKEKERILALKLSGSTISAADIDAIFASSREESVHENIGQTVARSDGSIAAQESDKKTDTGAAPAVANGATPVRFFRLAAVDEKYEFYTPPTYRHDLDLAGICNEYRNFACSTMHLYYDVKTVRLFLAGIAATKMVLLQGISGTGKTSLPYSFGKFLGNDATIASVQPSWRDRAELFGYFNEFTKKFNETDVFKRIYEASYNDNINIIVLDEMNIARVEYYFAEMLSVLELPDPNEWKLDIVPSSWPNDPKHLVGGKLLIPQNVWYVGTANNDDSTFAVSDKVYDRAFTINLDNIAEAFDAPPTGTSAISYSYVDGLYREALVKNAVSPENLKNISNLDMYVIQKFRMAFGNRIVKQLKIFVPVYMACGGTELDGIDYMLATKVIRKFESLNFSLIRDEIGGLITYLDKLFGKGTMKECIKYLERLQRMY